LYLKPSNEINYIDDKGYDNPDFFTLAFNMGLVPVENTIKPAREHCNKLHAHNQRSQD
jgi:hypothetical protein